MCSTEKLDYIGLGWEYKALILCECVVEVNKLICHFAIDCLVDGVRANEGSWEGCCSQRYQEYVENVPTSETKHGEQQEKKYTHTQDVNSVC